MAVKVALDTNAYSDFVRGESTRVTVVQRAARLYLPLFVLAELRAGFVASRQAQQNEAGLQQFLNSSRVEVLLPDESTSQHYAYLHRQLRGQGTPIPINDLWIAALVLQHHLVLCTSDSHFAHVPQIATC